MGAGSVMASPSRRWKLKPTVAKQTQGLVASHFGHLPASYMLFLQVPTGAGGAWLQALQAEVPISDAAGSKADDFAAAIAFSYSGLVAMGLPDSALNSFSQPFREGMHQIDRKRRLRDSDAPEIATEMPGGSRWGGNSPDPLAKPGDEATHTPITVHVALTLYAPDDAALQRRLEGARRVLAQHGLTVAHERTLSLRADEQGITREHFGFADGLSQPVPMGDAITPPQGPDAADQLKWHGVKAGEILLGHENIHNELAPGPMLEKTAPGQTSALSAEGAPAGYLNLGLNGSYLVIRELHQDVAAFWRSMDEAAARVNQPGVTSQWLAEKVLGRDLNGNTLSPNIAPAPAGDDPANNFGYAQTDIHGLGCPLGSHVRRANPRDSRPSRDGALQPDLSQSEQLLSAANAHRILRRGRKYGPDVVDVRQDDGQERGLMFMCLNSDLVRHFEFVQQTWLLNPTFATLLDETDPLLGLPGHMTIPACPVRLRPEVKSYVKLVGGEYFFLPSLPALDYLASLPASPSAP